jgi:hypothetical protein
MKRFVYSITSKSKITPEDYIDAYDTWLNASLASYTLERYAQGIKELTISSTNYIGVLAIIAISI